MFFELDVVKKGVIMKIIATERVSDQLNGSTCWNVLYMELFT